MEFSTWEPVYEKILADFGFDRSADERARDVLAQMAAPFELDRLGAVSGTTVAIAGAAPSLHGELSIARAADIVFAASTAADVLSEAGLEVDCLVTDLDKNPETAASLTGAGVPVAVHAHGDNIPALKRWVPTFAGEHVLATTQAAPTPPVRNLGGFTDGDRAAFLADHLGAARLVFPGWDFDGPTVGAEKRRKLRWAERLLLWLELRREERFGVLDGRRRDIDRSALPV